MLQEQFIKNFESETGWLLRFENEFAIFTHNAQTSEIDFQLNAIFWFMQICNCEPPTAIDILNSTRMKICSTPNLILTVKIKHNLKFD